MNKILTMVEGLKAETISPDGTVAARVNGTTGITIEINPDAYDSHTEETLRDQLEEVLVEATLTLDELASDIRRHLLDNQLVRTTELEAKRAQRRLFYEACEKVEVSASSTDNFVKVEWLPIGIMIEWNDSPLTELTSAELDAEINSAIASAGRERRRQFQLLRQKTYRTP